MSIDSQSQFDAEDLRQQFESMASDPTYKFRRSRRGMYVNPAVSRDWKWFQSGAAQKAPALTQPAVPTWLDPADAPKDGTLLCLQVEFEDGNLEDHPFSQVTIGHNSLKNTGVDEWAFAGWNWTHDCFTQGVGKVIGWLPLRYLGVTQPEPVTPFQTRVQPWLMECFGEMIAGDREERNHRFLEEALELVQACGCTSSEAHQLVDYTFSRPIGEPNQEVGGVMVTLAALCLANGLDMHADGDAELVRISAPEMVAKIRAKQAAKPKYSSLPEASPKPDAGIPASEYRLSCGCGRSNCFECVLHKVTPPTQYLQETDQQLLHRFIETTEDDESFDIGMPAVTRLADLGVVRNCGFGRYAVTMFGYWVHEHFQHQNPPLPLMTNADRGAAQKAKLAMQKGGA